MKVLGKVVAATTALALVGSPAFADNKGKGEEMRNKVRNVELTITGAIKTLTPGATPSVVIVLKTTSRPSDWKDAASILKVLLNNAGGVRFDVPASTTIRRADQNATFASLQVGDKVSMKATCTVNTATNPDSLGTCTATRINASPVPSPSPSPSPAPTSQLTVVGILTSIGVPGTGVVTVLTANRSGSSAVFSTGPLLATSRVFVTTAGTTLTGSPMAGSYVTLKATCTAAPTLAPSVTSPCTATSIAVIVPTA